MKIIKIWHFYWNTIFYWKCVLWETIDVDLKRVIYCKIFIRWYVQWLTVSFNLIWKKKQFELYNTTIVYQEYLIKKFKKKYKKEN